MALKKSAMQLVAEAEAEIETISAEDAKGLVNDENTVIVDLRDIRELWNVGTIPGSLHAPRGMLEFWVDPDSPYYRDVFGTGKKFIFFCAGALRSALATQQGDNFVRFTEQMRAEHNHIVSIGGHGPSIPRFPRNKAVGHTVSPR